MIQIRRIDQSRSAGMWVSGTVGDYRFRALVFAEHADNPDYELTHSKISKLWLEHNGHTVFDWDRGLDVEPIGEEAQDMVVRLCTELANFVNFKPEDRVQLLAMDDPNPIPVGELGTVRGVRWHDGWLQVEVDWDNGRRLMLSMPPDRVECV